MALVGLQDYEVAAAKKLSKQVYEFYRSGAYDELTLKLNRSAFDRIRLRPRVLRDINPRDLSCQVLGMNLPLPIGISPTAYQKMAHHDGELANARAAGNVGVPFTLALAANTSIEELGQLAPHTIKWFQMFIMEDPELTKRLVRRTEKAGFKAIVLTVDMPVLGLRRSDERDHFKMPSNLHWANLYEEIKVLVEKEGITNNDEHIKRLFGSKVTWADVKWLKSFAKIPVILKGILTPEDALMAAECGVDGIIVSNHGGRHLDSTPPAIEALPGVVRAVGDRLTVIFDSGIRQGTDVVKALALGAKLVMVGRPAVWGLSVNGQKGVEDVLAILKKEVDVAMGLLGCKTLADLTPNMVAHENEFCKL